MTSSPHGLYVQGYTRVTMQGTNRCQPARGANRKKLCSVRIAVCKLDCMKPESLVMAYQIDAVNTFPAFVHTARHITKVSCTRSRRANRKEAGAQGMTHDWGEVVTR